MATNFNTTRTQIVSKEDADKLMVKHGNADLNSTRTQNVNLGEAKELLRRHGGKDSEKKIGDLMADAMANARRRGR